MTDKTRSLCQEDAEIEALYAEIDAALLAYGASIDRGLALAAEMRQLANAIDAGLGDAQAELMEWL
jgi:hypothetical protein